MIEIIDESLGMNFQDEVLLPTIVEAKDESREEAELETELNIDADGDSIPNRKNFVICDNI